jgi:glycosyltransferase involved in cell wall biosynthesis
MTKPRVAVLVDLPRDAGAGGHVKYWERLAEAAAERPQPVDLTLYFSGDDEDVVLSPDVRFRHLPPVFSTARLKFLPYVPAHTDLASYHKKLAGELAHTDLVHTTDGYFAFAQTAEKIARQRRIPLTTSFHTDTPAYAELFTRQTLSHLFGARWGRFMDETLHIPARERVKKEKRLRQHLSRCAAALALRDDDFKTAADAQPTPRLSPMRLGVDKDLFAPDIGDRAALDAELGLAAGTFVILFVGRVDAGKNMPVLVEACERLLKLGARLHLIVAGQGPMEAEVKARLGAHVTMAGYVEPDLLARLYASVDCLAAVSEIEIGGMVGLEALACGCPVLTARQSDMARLCGAPAAMIEVERGAVAWAQALFDLARNLTRRKILRDAALDFRRDKLAGWGDVWEQDFLPVWLSLLRKA